MSHSVLAVTGEMQNLLNWANAARMVNRLHRLSHLRNKIRLPPLRMVDHRLPALLHHRRAHRGRLRLDPDV